MLPIIYLPSRALLYDTVATSDDYPAIEKSHLKTYSHSPKSFL